MEQGVSEQPPGQQQQQPRPHACRGSTRTAVFVETSGRTQFRAILAGKSFWRDLTATVRIGKLAERAVQFVPVGMQR